MPAFIASVEAAPVEDATTIFADVLSPDVVISTFGLQPIMAVQMPATANTEETLNRELIDNR